MEACLGRPAPRRAVVDPETGAVRAKASPNDTEIEALSACCAIVNASAGLSVHPRTPQELMAACLEGSDPSAWAAARDDILTGDLVDDDIVAYAAMHPVGHGISRAIERHDINDHIAAVAFVAMRLVAVVEGHCCDGMKPAESLVDHVVRHAATMTTTTSKEAFVAAMARVLRAAPRTHDAGAMASALLRCVCAGDIASLSLFVDLVTADAVRRRPQIVAELVSLAVATAPSRRGPALVLLAKISQGAPELVAGFDLRGLAASTLAATTAAAVMDVRLAAAVGTLLLNDDDDGDDALVPALARAVVTLAHAVQRATR
jgi:hypothetical protein